MRMSEYLLDPAAKHDLYWPSRTQDPNLGTPVPPWIYIPSTLVEEVEAWVNIPTLEENLTVPLPIDV
jgi:hypothetical protein